MRIGIDLGGTKIELLALDAAGIERWRRRIPTPQGDYAGIVAAIAGLVAACETELQMQATVGVGSPGALSPVTGRMKNANSLCLNGRDLKRDLEAALHRPVRLANDANCFALSEATDGAGRGAPVVFGVILGTGAGGGIVVQGRVLTGCNAIAGEWGHNPLPGAHDAEVPGPACYCGRRGCIEMFVSGPGLSADYAVSTGIDKSAQDIAELGRQGDQAAEQALLRYEDRLARSLALVINILDPEVVVLGGGMSKLERLYKNVPALWKRHIFSDRVDTVLAKPQHGDASGVRGAAWLWND